MAAIEQVAKSEHLELARRAQAGDVRARDELFRQLYVPVRSTASMTS